MKTLAMLLLYYPEEEATMLVGELAGHLTKKWKDKHADRKAQLAFARDALEWIRTHAASVPVQEWHVKTDVSFDGVTTLEWVSVK